MSIGEGEVPSGGVIPTPAPNGWIRLWTQVLRPHFDAGVLIRPCRLIAAVTGTLPLDWQAGPAPASAPDDTTEVRLPLPVGAVLVGDFLPLLGISPGFPAADALLMRRARAVVR
jgi:hypothetical protein